MNSAEETHSCGPAAKEVGAPHGEARKAPSVTGAVGRYLDRLPVDLGHGQAPGLLWAPVDAPVADLDLEQPRGLGGGFGGAGHGDGQVGDARPLGQLDRGAAWLERRPDGGDAVHADDDLSELSPSARLEEGDLGRRHRLLEGCAPLLSDRRLGRKPTRSLVAVDRHRRSTGGETERLARRRRPDVTRRTFHLVECGLRHRRPQPEEPTERERVVPRQLHHPVERRLLDNRAPRRPEPARENDVQRTGRESRLLLGRARLHELGQGQRSPEHVGHRTRAAPDNHLGDPDVRRGAGGRDTGNAEGELRRSVGQGPDEDASGGAPEVGLGAAGIQQEAGDLGIPCRGGAHLHLTAEGSTHVDGQAATRRRPEVPGEPRGPGIVVDGVLGRTPRKGPERGSLSAGGGPPPSWESHALVIGRPQPGHPVSDLVGREEGPTVLGEPVRDRLGPQVRVGENDRRRACQEPHIRRVGVRSEHEGPRAVEDPELGQVRDGGGVADDRHECRQLHRRDLPHGVVDGEDRHLRSTLGPLGRRAERRTDREPL